MITDYKYPSQECADKHKTYHIGEKAEAFSIAVSHYSPSEQTYMIGFLAPTGLFHHAINY